MVNDSAFRPVTLGSVLLVGPSEGVSDTAAALAATLVGDPGRQVVAADAPEERGGATFCPGLSAMLVGGVPVRLAVSGAGEGMLLSQAQWLANRLGTEVVAPDGVLRS